MRLRKSSGERRRLIRFEEGRTGVGTADGQGGKARENRTAIVCPGCSYCADRRLSGAVFRRRQHVRERKTLRVPIVACSSPNPVKTRYPRASSWTARKSQRP